VPARRNRYREKQSAPLSNHSRKYQARITGRPYSNEGKWNEEWLFEGIYFDGFLPAECMLQEAKSRYAKFLQRDKYGELEPVDWFEGWPSTISDISRQADAVNPFPPTRLTWYFEEPEPREYLLKELMRNSVLSVVQP